MESAGLRRLEDGVLAEASCSSHQLVSFFKVWLKALDQLTVTAQQNPIVPLIRTLKLNLAVHAADTSCYLYLDPHWRPGLLCEVLKISP